MDDKQRWLFKRNIELLEDFTAAAIALDADGITQATGEHYWRCAARVNAVMRKLMVDFKSRDFIDVEAEPEKANRELDYEMTQAFGPDL